VDVWSDFYVLLAKFLCAQLRHVFFTELRQLIAMPLFSSFSSSAFLTFNLFTTPLRLAHITLYSLRFFFLHLHISNTN